MSTGQTLLQFPAFAEAVDNCDKVLRPLGLHIFDILTVKGEPIFTNILYSIVGITVMQVNKFFITVNKIYN